MLLADTCGLTIKSILLATESSFERYKFLQQNEKIASQRTDKKMPYYRSYLAFVNKEI
jgi:hypothetical protein